MNWGKLAISFRKTNKRSIILEQLISLSALTYKHNKLLTSEISKAHPQKFMKISFHLILTKINWDYSTNWTLHISNYNIKRKGLCNLQATRSNTSSTVEEVRLVQITSSNEQLRTHQWMLTKRIVTPPTSTKKSYYLLLSERSA